MPRPPKSTKWTHSTSIDIKLGENDEVCKTKTNSQGYPMLTKSQDGYIGKKCTVIISDKFHEGKKHFLVSKTDQVYTCEINYRGNLSSVGLENANKEILVIIHK